MAAFIDSVVTKAGMLAAAKALAGRQLKFTKIVMGDGLLNGRSIDEIEGVISPKQEVEIAHDSIRSPSTAILGGVFINDEIEDGFYWRELGLYAEDPDEGEILYSYGNAGEFAEYIPARGSSTVIEKRIDILTYVGDVTSVSLHVSPDSYPTKAEFDDLVKKMEDWTKASDKAMKEFFENRDTGGGYTSWDHYEKNHLVPDEVTTTKNEAEKTISVKDGGISTTQLATDSVVTDKIKDANVTTPKLADGAVTEDKIDKSVLRRMQLLPEEFGSEEVDRLSQGFDVTTTAVRYEEYPKPSGSFKSDFSGAENHDNAGYLLPPVDLGDGRVFCYGEVVPGDNGTGQYKDKPTKERAFAVYYFFYDLDTRTILHRNSYIVYTWTPLKDLSSVNKDESASINGLNSVPVIRDDGSIHLLTWVSWQRRKQASLGVYEIETYRTGIHDLKIDLDTYTTTDLEHYVFLYSNYVSGCQLIVGGGVTDDPATSHRTDIISMFYDPSSASSPDHIVGFKYDITTQTLTGHSEDTLNDPGVNLGESFSSGGFQSRCAITVPSIDYWIIEFYKTVTSGKVYRRQVIFKLDKRTHEISALSEEEVSRCNLSAAGAMYEQAMGFYRLRYLLSGSSPVVDVHKFSAIKRRASEILIYTHTLRNEVYWLEGWKIRLEQGTPIIEDIKPQIMSGYNRTRVPEINPDKVPFDGGRPYARFGDWYIKGAKAYADSTLYSIINNETKTAALALGNLPLSYSANPPGGSNFGITKLLELSCSYSPFSIEENHITKDGTCHVFANKNYNAIVTFTPKGNQ